MNFSIFENDREIKIEFKAKNRISHIKIRDICDHVARWCYLRFFSSTISVCVVSRAVHFPSHTGRTRFCKWPVATVQQSIRVRRVPRRAIRRSSVLIRAGPSFPRSPNRRRRSDAARRQPHADPDTATHFSVVIFNGGPRQSGRWLTVVAVHERHHEWPHFV